MDLLEHEGKDLFAAAGLPVLPSFVAATPEEARGAAERLGPHVCVKAQAKTGGRGKAGGIRVCGSAGEVEAAAVDILAMNIRGHEVESLLVERAVEIAREMYIGVTVSREVRSPLLIFAPEGGMDIEEVARRDPAAILRRPIDPLLGLLEYQVRDVVDAAQFTADQPGGTGVGKALAQICRGLWKLYHDRDATLVEVNPLVLTTAGELVCLDAKVTIDDSALPRHPALEALRDLAEEDPTDIEARQEGLNFIKLEGTIGCMVNGAGLAMTTMDLVKRAGGEPANFLDIGGGARSDKVAAAMRLILADGNVRAILVNIFGGITRGDEVAHGLVEARAQQVRDVPMVVRIVGTNADEAAAILHAAAFETASSLDDAAAKAVAAAARAGTP